VVKQRAAAIRLPFAEELGEVSEELGDLSEELRDLPGRRERLFVPSACACAYRICARLAATQGGFGSRHSRLVEMVSPVLSPSKSSLT